LLQLSINHVDTGPMGLNANSARFLFLNVQEPQC